MTKFKNGWIDIDERLPKPGKICLGWFMFIGDIDGFAEAIEDQVFAFEYISGEISTGPSFFDNRIYLSEWDLTAWQPLHTPTDKEALADIDI